MIDRFNMFVFARPMLVLTTIILVVGLAAFPRSGHSDVTRTEKMTEIEEQIEKIRSEKSEETRVELAVQLADMVKAKNSKEISDREIEALSRKLEDRDDFVTLWVAVALGHIGPRGVSAIPALKKVFCRVRCTHRIVGGLTSEPAIRFAITKIGASLPVCSCDN